MTRRLGGPFCYAMVLLSRKSSFRAGFPLNCSRANIEFGLPAGRRPAGVPILRFLPSRIRPKSGPETRCPDRKHSWVQQGSSIRPRVLVRFSAHGRPGTTGNGAGSKRSAGHTGLCEKITVRDLVKSESLGPSMSPNHINSYGLVTFISIAQSIILGFWVF